MSIKHVQFALDGVPGLNAGQRLTLVSLGEWANDDGECWPSHDTIAKRVGVGRRQVIRIIEQLESMGVVERVERKQHSNKYLIRCDIAMSHLDVTSRAHVTLGADGSDVTLGTPDVTSRTADVTSRASRCDIAMSPEPPRTTNRTTKEPPERARAKALLTAAPDVFEVSDEMYGWAWSELEMQRAVVDRETAKMLDHFRAKGERRKDWLATWRNWLRRSLEFSRPAASNGRASPARVSNYDISAANIDAAGEPDDPFGTGPVYETTGRIRS